MVDDSNNSVSTHFGVDPVFVVHPKRHTAETKNSGVIHLGVSSHPHADSNRGSMTENHMS